MASAAPHFSLQRLLLEPVRGPSLIICGLIVWLPAPAIATAISVFFRAARGAMVGKPDLVGDRRGSMVRIVRMVEGATHDS